MNFTFTNKDQGTLGTAETNDSDDVLSPAITHRPFTSRPTSKSKKSDVFNQLYNEAHIRKL